MDNNQNWEEIHESFGDYWNGKKYQNLWTQQGFTYQTTQEWAKVISKIFKPQSDWAFCAWLGNIKQLTPSVVKDKLEDLRMEYNKLWTEIDRGFSERVNKYSSWTYQQSWEAIGLTYQEAQILIPAGFTVKDCWTVKDWKYHRFTPQQTQAWLTNGLTKDDYELAAYCWGKEIQPNQANQDLIEQIKSNGIPAPEYLGCFYPQNWRNKVTILSLGYKNLSETLDLSDFTNLEKLICLCNKLTTLNLVNCPKLRKLHCANNLLTNLDLSHNLQLEYLDIKNNNLTEQDLTFLSHLVDLKYLYLGNDDQEWINQSIYNKFTGSLAFLKSLTKLERLDIDSTDLVAGLEYLPASLEEFNCSFEARPQAKCQTIYNLFAYEQGRVETDEDGWIKNFPKKLQILKEWQQVFTEEEISQWIILKLSLEKLEWASYCQARNIPWTQFKTEIATYQNNFELWKENYLNEQLTLEKAKIPTLENEITKLTNLIKQQKEKIIQAYLHFFTEKELLKELITTHLELTRFKKEGINSPDYDEELEIYDDKCKEIRKQLRSKVTKEEMNLVREILVDCEELIHYETELQQQINQNQKLIIHHEGVIQQITYQISNLNLQQGHVMIGNTLGDNTDLNYRLQEQLQTQIQIPPKK